MRLLGFEITRTKQNYQLVGDRGNWWWPASRPVVREPFTGAWQRNYEVRSENLLAHNAVYACIERIASDVATCRLMLVEMDGDGVWAEVMGLSPYRAVLETPNSYQTRIQFFEDWVRSKLMYGNTYVLKEREDVRGIVKSLYVLDPMKTKPLVAPDGGIYYQLSKDNLAGIEDSIIVPASEIIHDMTSVRHHSLCGLPPMAPASLAATHGLNIQNYSTKFFMNASSPGALLTAPGEMTQAKADRLKAQWTDRSSGDNVGMLMVAGDGLIYTPLSATALNSQLIEQLGLSAKMVCSAFGVPPYKVQVGEAPKYDNVGAQNQSYYDDCLRKYFESIELLLDKGLGLTAVSGKTYGTEFDTYDLLRMDPAAQADTIVKLTGAGLLKLNEGRKRLGYRGMEGGDNAFMQQQYFTVPTLAAQNVAVAAPPAPAPSVPVDDSPPAKDFDVLSQIYKWKYAEMTAGLSSEIGKLAA